MVWTDSLTHCAAASSILARSRYREIGVDGQRSVNWVRTRNSPSAGRSRERPASILAPDMIQSSVGQAVQNTTGEAFVRMPRLHFYRSATPTSQTGARDEWTKQPRANARHSIAEARRTNALATRRSIARHRGKSPNARSSARFASNCSIMPLEPPKSDIHSIASASWRVMEKLGMRREPHFARAIFHLSAQTSTRLLASACTLQAAGRIAPVIMV